MGLLQDPHVLKVYESWLIEREGSGAPSCVGFITEIMTAGSLHKFVHRVSDVVRPAVVRKWCRQLLDALKFLHSQAPPYVHGALNLQSVFVNGATGDIRLGNFLFESLGQAREGYESVAYSAPEQLREHDAAEALTTDVDVYAFAMCVLELATREAPFCEGSKQLYRDAAELAALKLAVRPRARARGIRAARCA
jgi:WNK lysine deficient protein kinase